jgi:ubiquinone/menaquinone biosynthesis C-methylase UbiE
MPGHNETIVDQFTRQAVPFSNAPAMRDRQALHLLIEATGAGADDIALDVACGPGIVACAFAAEVARVVGIDLTPAMIDRARALAAEGNVENVSFQVGDVLPLPFADASFSIVVSRFAFHHFRNPAAVLAEMVRVCRPGGCVAVADLLASPDPARAEAFHRMEILRDPSHARALTLAELRRLFADAGLPVTTETPWRFDVDFEGWLARSFPVAGSEPVIRQMFADSVANDAMGLATRREDGRLAFTYSNVVLAARRPVL